jgi:predicted transposase YbfD/YdcC
MLIEKKNTADLLPADYRATAFTFQKKCGIIKYMKIQSLKEKVSGISDPRRTNYGNIRHKLEDIIVIGLCTVICGGEDFVDMEDFGKEREEFLRKFLELPNGIPDSDTFRRVFEKLDPMELSECLVNWLNEELPERCVIAVDGKTIRGSANKEHKAYHVVSAFVAENQITLGEICVDEKSNEITAVPELLDLLYIDDAIITADSMSCQKKIVQKIADNNGDYCIALKENQPNLFKDTVNYFRKFAKECEKNSTTEKGHGRIEKREYFLCTDIDWLENRDEWANLNAIGMVNSKVRDGDSESEFTRYFITSLTDINEFAYAVRKHWSIENQLHWCLDVIFREDSAKARKDYSPLNMNVLRKTALSLLNKAKYGRLSKQRMMFKASLNPEVLLSVLLAAKK